MEETAAFVGSIPENYDRYLGPAFFEPYASDLAARLNVSENAKVLELACGTGILTKRLNEKHIELTATDLNDAMIDYAKQKFQPDAEINWKQADMCELPFDDESFDAVVCQFGFMFVPDKQQAFNEAHRVLKPGGDFLFNVWDSLDNNDFARTAHQTVTGFFEEDPPQFYQVPFSLFDADVVRSFLDGANFKDSEVTKLSLPCVSPSASDAAKGLIHGNPIINAIMERRPSDVGEIENAVAETLADEFGDDPVRCKMQAFVWSATK